MYIEQQRCTTGKTLNFSTVFHYVENGSLQSGKQFHISFLCFVLYKKEIFTTLRASGLIPAEQKRPLFSEQSFVVPRMGVEPTRPNGHMALNHACLPIPAPR